MKITVCTLGCKTNQFECQAMEKLFRAMGYELVSAEEAAEAYVINSCTVTSTADKKTRQLIRHLKRLHPSALVAVCGCMVQAGNGTELKALCGADIVGGNRDYRAFAECVDRALRERRLPSAPVADMGCGFQRLPAGGLNGRTRALLKIEDGCENFCTYCIIPYARGPIRSLPLEEAVAQTRQLCDQGFREIVLTGIEISAYGADQTPRKTLCDLVEAACLAAGDVRISLGSLKPTMIDEAFCSRLSKLGNLCRHFHLSVQSGCTETLKRMNRKYGAGDIRRAVSLLRSYFGDPNITADLIVGFPGETEEEFSETLQTLEECRFGDAHVFPFSVRAGTAAERLPNRVLNAEKKERCARCAALCERTRNEYLDRQIGTSQTVLLEEDGDAVGGYTDRYVYVSVGNPGGLKPGELVETRIAGRRGGELLGEVCG